jgi:hypothetical protein
VGNGLANCDITLQTVLQDNRYLYCSLPFLFLQKFAKSVTRGNNMLCKFLWAVLMLALVFGMVAAGCKTDATMEPTAAEKAAVLASELGGGATAMVLR